MKMSGEQRIAAPRAKVWEALNDSEILKQCIPGCQSLERESADRLKAAIAIKIGPISARFAGAVTLSDFDPPNSYTISGEGQGGAAGFAKGGAKVRLADDSGGTLLTYDVDAQVGGRLAQLGGPVIEATAKQLAASFFKKFGQIAAASAVPEQAAEGAPAQPSTGPTAAPAPPEPPATSTPLAPPAIPQNAKLPVYAIAGLAAAALLAFLLGRIGGAGMRDVAGIAAALLVVIVALAAFEFGRRAASPTITLDRELLERLSSLTDRNKR